MPNKPRQRSETATKHWERLDAVIRRRFVASNMSDTKWVKLLRAATLFSAVVPRMNYKLVYGPEVRHSYTPLHAESVKPEWFLEPLIYKELEWIEFPFTYEVARGSGLAALVQRQDTVGLQRHLQSIANFPFQATETGLRVVAYVGPWGNAVR